MSLKEDLTIIFVSYLSKNLIEKPIKQINNNIPIIVVENSKDIKLKEYLENKYKNVDVIIPKENTGNGGGINIGLRAAKTKYALYLDIDVELENSTLEELYSHASKIQNFSILAPRVRSFIYKEDFYIEKNVMDNVHKMNFITGCALFFNMDAISKIGFFDENIFLYYEENDFYLRSMKNNYYIYLIEKSVIQHIGNESTDLIKKDDIEINRNWHYMWSTFYFHKKHYGILHAYYKTIFKFISAMLKYALYLIKRDKLKKEIYFARISGIFNSMIGKKSWHRTKIDKNIEYS